MIKLFNSVDALYSILESFRLDKQVLDYRIIVGANNLVTVFIISEVIESLQTTVEEYGATCFFITDDDTKEEYSFYFESPNRVDYRSSRIRLDNLVDQDSKREPINIPIITFYSYKGGVGRSTLLSSYAIHSSNQGKTVVVLDCDFEAPGFDNFFVEDQSAIEYSNGLVEFFLDSEVDDDLSLSGYYREASKAYSGSGEIFVFSAGNLDTSNNIGNLFCTNLDHYLNGLSRLNIFSKDYIVERFNTLFLKIEKELHPDVILIDSRTGFNDLYGIASLRFSQVVVGLFGVDIQSRPGLEYFMNFLLRENAPRLMLVNSVIPPGMKMRLFQRFKDYVNSYLEDLSAEKDEGIFNLDLFPVSYDATLSNIGKPGEVIEEYISLIKDNANSEYSTIFTKIDEYIIDANRPRHNRRSTKLSEDDVKEVKTTILKNILKHKPALYGEDIKDFSTELKSGRFFFRSSMADLFNGNKFLVVGNKGTGKTYLYRSLGNPKIVEELKKRANKVNSDYLFIQAISTVAGHSLDTVKLDGAYDLSQSDLFFERLWQIYIWSSIMSSSPFGYQTKLELVDLSDTTESANSVVNLISQTDFIISIEKDLDSLSHYLSQRNKRIVVVFDELDTIVKPIQWPERISPLINLCRKWQFANISVKLFLRSDLYEKTTNITNKNALNNRMIRIEWTREELFAYFFNLVLSHSREQFETIVGLNNDYPIADKRLALNAIRKNSISLEEPALKVMCAAFFGKFADAGTSHRFGESYDWFYTNLKNANETISLRPFIDLITLSIGFSIKDDNSALPILPACYYTYGKTRAEAVERHFKDLAQEKGNTDLVPIFDYIQNKAPAYLKLDKMTQWELFSLLDAILAEGSLTENSSRDELIELLTVNGIIKSVYVRLRDGTHRNYHFALLYKYYLGLRSNPKIR